MKEGGGGMKEEGEDGGWGGWKGMWDKGSEGGY